jgi:hypothetical protein
MGNCVSLIGPTTRVGGRGQTAIVSSDCGLAALLSCGLRPGSRLIANSGQHPSPPQANCSLLLVFSGRPWRIRVHDAPATFLQIRDRLQNASLFRESVLYSSPMIIGVTAPPFPLARPRSRSGVLSPLREPKTHHQGLPEKKLEAIRFYRCRSCDDRFSPGRRSLRSETYPVSDPSVTVSLASWRAPSRSRDNGR